MSEFKVPVNEKVELYKKVKFGKRRPKLRRLFELLGFVPTPFQEKIIKVIDEDYKEWHTLVLTAGRRSGKSTSTALITTLEMLIPNSSVALITPSSKQLDFIFNDVLKFLRKLNIEPEKLNTNEKFIRLSNGAVFRGNTAKTVTNLEGLELSLLIIEEMYLQPTIKDILNSLSPALSTYGVFEDTKIPIAKTIMLGSIKANKEAYEYYLKGVRGEKGYKSIKFTALQNPLLSKEFLDSEKEKLGERVFLQEYLCEPVILNEKAVFYAFDYNKNVKDLDFIKSVIDKDSIVVGGLDIGATDSTSYLLIYVENGKFYVFDGFMENNLSEKQIADKIKIIEKKYNIEVELRFIDPSAKLTRIGLANDYEVITYPALNSINDSINTLNQLFENEKLFIDKNLNWLIEQIQKIEWSNNRKSSDPFKKHSEHHFDAIASLRYGIYSYLKFENTGNFEVI